MMKIGVISDIHGFSDKLEKVIEDMERQEVDGVIILGDVVVGGPNPFKCMSMLKELNHMAWVKGNTDDWLDKTHNYDDYMGEINYVLDHISDEDKTLLFNLPECEVLKIEGVSIMCCHGSRCSLVQKIGVMTPEVELVNLFEEIERDKIDLLLSGHTHIPYTMEQQHKMIINVGSVGFLYEDNSKASYGLLEVDGGQFNFEQRFVTLY